MAKIDKNLPQTPAAEPITPVQPGQVDTGQVLAKPVAKPASNFQSGTPGLQGKFAYAPAVRAGAFANSPGHKIGLNRPTTALALNLGPNGPTVGDLLTRLEENIHNPQRLTDHDQRVLQGALDVVVS